ncbi:hypothetical protein ABNF97_28325 [Plantactinospora sp. B6F1]|uniref:hypothetical protein n=1 Tax=Plantactinospora sp. B6F1 TaxID=3158971 RepID=UPI0032D95741
MRFSTGRGIRKRFLVPITALCAVVGLLLAGGPAQAATYNKYTRTQASNQDAGGIDTWAWLNKVGAGSEIDYQVHFQAYGEKLWVYVRVGMASKGKVTVVVYDTTGKHVDTDTFTVDIGENRELNLGTPDGSGNIAEGYTVYSRICVGNSTTCTPYAKGRA